MKIPLDLLWAMEPTALQMHVAQLRTLGALTIDVSAIMGEQPKAATVIDGVAIVKLTGPLMKSDGWLTRWLEGTSMQSAAQAVTAAASDKSIRGIALFVDSPGGTVDGLAELGDAIAQASKTSGKRVVAQVVGMAASAAYYAASQAQAVYAGRMDMIGSIGTILPMYDYSKAFDEAGIEAVPIESGPFKSAGMMGTEITEEQRKYFQGLINGYFDDFVKAVSSGRAMSIADVRKVADGRVFLAKDAKASGLIDGIRTFDQTIGAMPKRRTNRRTAARIELARRIIS